MKLCLIAAVAKNRVIGKDEKLPWHISEDLKRFKRLTVGHAVVMGRKTWESIGRPLVNRRNVVLTSTPAPGVECFFSLDDALTALADQDKVFVIGGAQIYAAALHRADALYLTLVDQEPDGDAFFPAYEDMVRQKFSLVLREDHQGYSFLDYIRL